MQGRQRIPLRFSVYGPPVTSTSTTTTTIDFHTRRVDAVLCAHTDDAWACCPILLRVRTEEEDSCVSVDVFLRDLPSLVCIILFM